MRDARLLAPAGLVVAAALLIGLTAVGAWGLWVRDHQIAVGATLAEAVIYAGAAWLVVTCDTRWDAKARHRAVLLILGVALVMRALVLVPLPISSDIYRYVWDGRVQAAGINPYHYLPVDAALAPLRDEAIYAHINRPDYAVTIYPPAAQMIFLAVTRLSETITAMKLAMIGFEIAIVAALFGLLRRRGLPETRVLLYAWHPLPLFEFANGGHIDAAAIALLLLACLAADRRKPGLAGAIMAAAVAVKYFPAVVAPALYRRWDWRFPAAGLVTIALLYLPYLGVGWGVLGYLSGYAHEEGLVAGDGFFPIALLRSLTPLPPSAPLIYLALGALALIGLALGTMFRNKPDVISFRAVMALVLLFTVLLSPHLPWYFTWLVPFLCFRPSAAVIYLTGAAPLLYNTVWEPGLLIENAAIYAPFAIILLIETLAGLRPAMTKEPEDGSLDRSPAA